MTTTLSGIAEELERRAYEAEDIEPLVAVGKSIAYREAATLIRTADDREKVLMEALGEVLRYYEGRGEYNFSSLPTIERSNAAFDAWLEIEARVRQALGATNAK